MINSVRYADLGEAGFARRIDIENNLNSCAPHTTGESGFAPTLDHWWARRVSPLQNWYSIIYIHNGMINSVHYAELGEARQRPQ